MGARSSIARGSRGSVLDNEGVALAEFESTSSGPGNGVAVPEADSRSSVPDSNVTRPESETRRSVLDNGVALPESESARSSKNPPKISPVLDGVTELLQCSVCLTPMYPRINQCPNGHLLCSNCRNEVSKCPICRIKMGNIQCLALEKFAEFFELPCAYRNSGCEKYIPYNSKAKHEESCSFRPYSCGHANGCSVTGDIPRIVAHLRDDENAYMLSDVAFRIEYLCRRSQGRKAWKLLIVNCFERNFCVHFERFQHGDFHVYMCFIRCMGGENEANKFRYSLEVGAHDRKLTWQGIPRSIRDSAAKVRNSLDGLIIPHGLALFFSSEYQEGVRLGVDVTGRIWEVKE